MTMNITPLHDRVLIPRPDRFHFGFPVVSLLKGGFYEDRFDRHFGQSSAAALLS